MCVPAMCFLTAVSRRILTTHDLFTSVLTTRHVVVVDAMTQLLVTTCHVDVHTPLHVYTQHVVCHNGFLRDRQEVTLRMSVLVSNLPCCV